jgi:hypothetical protein
MTRGDVSVLVIVPWKVLLYGSSDDDLVAVAALAQTGTKSMHLWHLAPALHWQRDVTVWLS